MKMRKPLNPWKLTGYKAGQSVGCKVVAAEPGGYSVIIPKDNLPGFLPTEQRLKPGEEILCQFVCVHNNRMLLSSRFSGSMGPAQQGAQQQQQQETQTIKSWSVEMANAPYTAAPPPETDAAFNVWAQAPPRQFHLKRATDLMIPPIDGSQPNTFKIGEYDLEWLITDLEGGMRTGCVKAACQERKSRSAMLLYRGRVVGCI